MMLILIVSLILSFASSCLPCRCAQAHIQTNICKSDFAVALVPIEESKNDSVRIWGRLYKFTLNAIYKATPEAEEALNKGEVYTGLSGASCRLRLQKGRLYVVTGSVYNGIPIISTCRLNVLWERLSVYQQEALHSGEYVQSCKCQICGPIYPHQCKQSTYQPCHFNRHEVGSSCYRSYSYCQLKDDQCRWDSNQQLDDCTERTKHGHVY